MNETEEAHAEVCFAEVNFMLMILHFVAEQTLMAMVRGALKFRACNNAYKCVLMHETVTQSIN